MSSEKRVLNGTVPSKAAQTPKLDLAALDGLRAVACAAVMSYHSFMYWGSLLDLDVAHKFVDAQPLLRLAMNGSAGVDVFLVLTGLWAAHALLPALEGAAGQGRVGATRLAIGSYYRKRAARLLPEYATTLLLLLLVDHSSALDPALRRNHDTTFQHCLASFPLNLVFLQNFVGFGACGLVLWSLAVQVQFYLIFPLLALALRPRLAGFRGRVALGAAAWVVLGSLARLAAAHALGVRLPVAVINHPEMDEASVGQTVAYYHSMYFSTPGRSVNLAVGVLLGCLLLSPRALRALHAGRRHVASASLILAAVAWRVLGGLRFHGTASDPALAGGPALAALVLHGSPLYSALAAATILSLMLRAGVGGRAVAWALRSRVARGAAALSYNAYLLQMLAMFWAEAWLLPQGALAALARARPLACLGVIMGGTLASTAALAGAHAWVHARLAAGLLCRWLR